MSSSKSRRDAADRPPPFRRQVPPPGGRVKSKFPVPSVQCSRHRETQNHRLLLPPRWCPDRAPVADLSPKGPPSRATPRTGIAAVQASTSSHHVLSRNLSEADRIAPSGVIVHNLPRRRAKEGTSVYNFFSFRSQEGNSGPGSFGLCNAGRRSASCGRKEYDRARIKNSIS
jgi:hypothetical protein